MPLNCVINSLNEKYIFCCQTTSLVYTESTGSTSTYISDTGINTSSYMVDSYIGIFITERAIYHIQTNVRDMYLIEDIQPLVPYRLSLISSRFIYLNSISGTSLIIQKYSRTFLELSTYVNKQIIMNYFIYEAQLFIEIETSSIKVKSLYTRYILLQHTYSVVAKTSSVLLNIDYVKLTFQNYSYYHALTNTVVIVFYKNIILIDGTTYKMDFANKFTEEIIGTSIDKINGKLYLSNTNQDCCIDFATRTMVCQKENQNYNPATVILLDRLYATFLNPIQNQVIFCQLGSIRIYSQSQQKYVKAYYDDSFNPEFLFYNEKLGYIIFQNKVTYVFKEFNISTFALKSIDLPTLNQSTSSYTKIIVQFLDDGTYLYASSDLLYISFYNQITHTLIAQVPIPAKLDYLTELCVDYIDGYLFYTDTNRNVDVISFRNRKYLGTLLSTGTALYQPTYFSYDQAKKKLIVTRADTLFIADMIKQRIVFIVFTNDYQYNVALTYEYNKFFLSSVLNTLIVDYQQILQNNNPNNYQPKFLKIDDETIIHINDNLSVISLYQGTNLVSQITFKQQRQSSFYVSFKANYSQLLVFLVDQIYVLDISNRVLKISNIITLESKYLKIIKETTDQIIIQLQSQKLIYLNRSIIDNKINQLVQLPNGLCVFATTQKYIAFSDCISNDKLQVLDINTFSLTTGQLTNQLINIKNLGDNNPQIVILTTVSIILYDISTMSQVKEVLLSLPQDSTIKVDFIYNRIFVVNQLFDTYVFNFKLEQFGTRNIQSFGLNIQFDEKFIYYISSHSAYIYFRKDLQLMMNFRKFNTAINLQKITYLNVGYFFLVEFVEQISIYELSPFLQTPKLKYEIPLQNYVLIDFQLQKLNKENPNDYIYVFKIYGINFQNTFNYFLHFNLYGKQSQVSCSQSYELLQDSIFDQGSILNLNQQLITLKQTLSSLTVKIEKEQIIRPPNIIRTSLSSSSFDLEYTSSNEIQSVKINSLFLFDSQINNLKLQNILLKIDPQSPTSIVINPQKFKGLKKLHLENIALEDIDLTISDLNVVIIQKLKIMSTSLQYKSQLTMRNITSIKIVQIEMSDQSFSILNSMINISQSKMINIGSIDVNSVQLMTQTAQQQRQLILNSSQKIFLQLFNIGQLQISSLNINKLTLDGTYLLDLQNIETFQIEKIEIQNLVINNNSQQEYFLNKFVNFTDIKINELNLNIVKYSSYNKLIVNKFSQLQTLTILKGEYSQIQFKNYQSENSFIFHLESIQKTQIQNIKFTNSGNIGFLNAIPLKLTRQIVSSIIDINIFQVEFLNLSEINLLIYIKSLVANIEKISFNNINVSKKYQQSSIQIQSEESIRLQDVIIKQTINNIQGFIQITQSSQIVLNRVNFQQVTTFGSASCLMISDSPYLEILESTFEDNLSISDSGSIFIKNIEKILLNNNYFRKNSSQQGSGGAIYCDESTFEQINNNHFSENDAKNGSGGVFYLKNCEIKQLISNQFNSNSAFIGGAIRYQKFKPFILLPKDSLKNIKKNNIFFKNSCSSYGKDIGSYPFILDVKNSFEDDVSLGIAKLKNVPSGQKPDEPLKLRFIDEELREVSFFDNSVYSSIDENIRDEFSLYFLVAESEQIGLFGELNQGYDLQQFAFTFDLSYTYFPEKSEKITIKSTRAFPTFVKDKQEVTEQIQQIDVEVIFRRCKIGELLQQQEKYQICLQCATGSYNLIDPYDEDNKSCKKCPLGSNSCQKNEIVVKDGYWRENNQSDKIVYCDKKPENCQPENPKETINLCITGHIGPLCEECDSRGQIWNSTYGKNTDLTCVDCVKFSNTENMSLLVLVFTILLAYLYFQIYKQISVSQKQILTHYLIRMGITVNALKGSTLELSSHMKILISYFQFLAIINSLNIKVALNFQYLNLFGGDTSYQTLSRVDCLLFQLPTKLPAYILRIFWLNTQPVILLIATQIVGAIVLRFKNVQNNRSSIYTSAIFIFMFFQPSIIKVLSESFSCIDVGSKLYVISDLTQECYGNDHINNIVKIILPILLVWLILIPCFLIWRMHYYRFGFKKILVVYRYGFLYQEYRHEVYYWDIVRLYLRSLMIILVNVIRFSVILQGLLIVGLLLIYVTLQYKNNPYQSIKLNKTDRQQCIAVLLTLYGVFLGHYFDNSTVTYFTLIFVATINLTFIIKMAKSIIVKPIPFEPEKRNFFQTMIMKFKNKFPYLFSWVLVQKNSLVSCHKNWNKVRNLLDTIKQSQKEVREFQNYTLAKNVKLRDDFIKTRAQVNQIILSLIYQNSYIRLKQSRGSLHHKTIFESNTEDTVIQQLNTDKCMITEGETLNTKRQMITERDYIKESSSPYQRQQSPIQKQSIFQSADIEKNDLVDNEK